MPRPAGNQRESNANGVGKQIANVGSAVRHEQLMQLVARRIRHRDQQRPPRAPRINQCRQTTGHGAEHDGPETEVLDRVKDLLGDSARRRRIRLRGQIEDSRHVEGDRRPQRRL
jgi:hypothetical protein